MMDGVRGLAMAIDDIKKRFVDEIKLRAYDDRYIDKIEEREILQIAIQLGVDLESARAAFIQVCEEHDFVIESRVVKLIKDRVQAAAGADGTLDRSAFEAIVSAATKAVNGKKNDREVKRMIVQVMEETANNKVRSGWFRNWYTSLKKDLGV
jgi:hypothetical protein